MNFFYMSSPLMYRKTVGKLVCLLVFQQLLFPLYWIVNDVAALLKAMRTWAWTLRIVRGSPFLSDWASYIPKKVTSAFPQPGFLCPLLPTHDTRFNATWKFTELFNCIQYLLCVFLQNCIFSPDLERLTHRILWGKEGQKKRKKGSFFGLFSCCL